MNTQAQDLFTRALELGAGERPAFLAEACAGDPELRHEVELLLADAARADSFFAATLVTDGADDSGPGLTEREGDVIGPYTLRQQIGEGGFGVVWMAEQSRPISRMVALKVIKAGMDTKQVLARFEAERQALAMMDHPNIARVLDAGATATGRPWFAMELVKGIPITRFCDDQGLGTKERLALFRDVCAAINHAHQKGIIHRDIKPSNVMVTLHGDKPVVKVIDFGIAKATHGKLTEQTLFTKFEQFIGTPVYMSPEQASLSGLDIDTRSDIYALGILLYELLVGKPPFDAKSLVSAGYEEMRRIIREVEPPKPSSRLSTVVGEERTQMAKSRQIDEAKLYRLVEPDLDWIVMKAIDKDRTRRYETANAFAQDIVRFLADEAVMARPPSAGYQFRKFARRHKSAIRVAAVIAAVLVAATVVSTWQAIRATWAEAVAAQEMERTRAALADAESTSKFLTDMFARSQPGGEKGGREVKVVDVLDSAVAALKADQAIPPARRVRLQETLGSTYSALGMVKEAIPLRESVRDHHRDTSGATDPKTLDAMVSLAHAYIAAGRWEEAIKLHEEVLAIQRQKNGAAHPGTVSAACALAIIYHEAGRREEAMALRETTLPLSRKALGPEHPATMAVLSGLAQSYHDGGRREEALGMFEELLALRRRILGPEHSETTAAITQVAHAYSAAGRQDEALKLHAESLELSRKTLGPNHPRSLWLLSNLATTYYHANRKEEALVFFEESLKLHREVLGPENPYTLWAIHSVALCYHDAGRGEEALAMREGVLASRRKLLGADHLDTLSAMTCLAGSYDETGRWPQAVALREEVETRSRNLLGPEHPTTHKAMENLADCYGKAGRQDQALKLREELLALRRKVLGPKHPDTLSSMTHLANAYENVGRKDAADVLRTELNDLKPKPKPFPPVIATLVPPDSEWKWLHPTDGIDPSEQDVDFHRRFFAPDYDDSAWKTGKDSANSDGGFGYGRDFAGLDIGTPEVPSHRHSAYFRHRFTTDKPHTSLELRCQRDDALVVYLDGTEVLRDNLPDGPDAYRLSASVPQGPDNDGVVHRFPIPGNLEPGEHVLAISVHNAVPTSSDLRIGAITLVEAGGK